MTSGLRAAIVFLAFSWSALFPRDGLAQEPGLRGIRTVGLYVPSIKGAGPTPAPDSQRLGDIVELKLRREGITVLRDSLSPPYLKLEVVCAEGTVYPVLACSLSLALRDMTLLRKTAEIVFVDLWSRGRIVLATRNSLVTGLERYASEVADDFILDWLRENPNRSDQPLDDIGGPAILMPPNKQLLQTPHTVVVCCAALRQRSVYRVRRSRIARR